MAAIDRVALAAKQAQFLRQPSIVTWSRLEPLPMTRGDLTPGLQALLGDPLWLVGRQWQFDELQAEDAGSPILVTVEGSSAPITRFHAGPLGDQPQSGSVDAPSVPLEVAVEAEAPSVLPERIRAEGGQQLLRLLAVAANLTAPQRDVARERFVTTYRFAVGDDTLSREDPAGAARRRVLAGRVPDGSAVLADLAGRRSADGTVTGLPAPLAALTPPEAIQSVLTEWARWFEAYLASPVGAGGGGAAPFSWNPYRLEYSFAAQATTAGGDVLLTAQEYTDGRLDWYDFEASARPTLGAPVNPVAPERISSRLLVTPVRFPGMPADRLWEIEDSRVYLGQIQAAPHDIARLGLVEYALAYGNDWYVAPVDLRYGTVCEITAVTVLDTFGGRTAVPRALQAAGPNHPGWCVYHLNDAADVGRLSDVFVLPPTVRSPLEGPPVEEVALFRDEMADLVWGVERVVQGPTGEPVPWGKLAGQVSLRQTVPADLGDARIIYRLMAPLPENWIPFVAVPATGRPVGSLATDLERQPLIRFEEDGTVTLVHPRGVLLRSADDADVTTDRLRVADEEVPRDGAVVRRTFQLARTEGGGTVLWLGRAKSTGKGEGYSGLRFDTALPPQGV